MHALHIGFAAHKYLNCLECRNKLNDFALLQILFCFKCFNLTQISLLVLTLENLFFSSPVKVQIQNYKLSMSETFFLSKRNSCSHNLWPAIINNT